MTPKEHRMLITMFQYQTLAFKSLIEVLRSQGFVKEGDLDAYDALLSLNDKVRSELVLQVEEDYLEAARVCGVATGLSDEG